MALAMCALVTGSKTAAGGSPRSAGSPSCSTRTPKMHGWHASCIILTILNNSPHPTGRLMTASESARILCAISRSSADGPRIMTHRGRNCTVEMLSGISSLVPVDGQGSGSVAAIVDMSSSSDPAASVCVPASLALSFPGRDGRPLCCSLDGKAPGNFPASCVYAASSCDVVFSPCFLSASSSFSTSRMVHRASSNLSRLV
mmetsp:Transcript_28757/g.61090  ORF Transcript_28757/g.61090 Transcript_28757/m.61090 type:complete len:201 (+) Transcript_28757:1033-1635(+)